MFSRFDRTMASDKWTQGFSTYRASTASRDKKSINQSINFIDERAKTTTDIVTKINPN